MHEVTHSSPHTPIHAPTAHTLIPPPLRTHARTHAHTHTRTHAHTHTHLNICTQNCLVNSNYQRGEQTRSCDTPVSGSHTHLLALIRGWVDRLEQVWSWWIFTFKMYVSIEEGTVVCVWCVCVCVMLTWWRLCTAGRRWQSGSNIFQRRSWKHTSCFHDRSPPGTPPGHPPRPDWPTGPYLD